MTSKRTTARPPSSPTSGSMIRTARLKQGLSLSRLAERVGTVKGVIGDIETDRYERPDPERLVKLATALEIDERQVLEAAGYTYLKELPDLPVYLRTKYHLPDEALKHMKAQWEFVRARYGIEDDPNDKRNDRS